MIRSVTRFTPKGLPTYLERIHVIEPDELPEHAGKGVEKTGPTAFTSPSDAMLRWQFFSLRLSRW